MQKWLNVLVVLGLSVLLNACVEVKDANEETGPVVIKGSLPSAIIDEEMFLYQGDLLTRAEFMDIEAAGFADGLNQPLVYDFESLEITSRGALYTFGQTVRLNIKKLVSDNGSIQTFPEAAMASRNVDGRSGGLLHINIQEARGFLSLVMRGEQGGRGALGRESDESLRGSTNFPGCFPDTPYSVPAELARGKKGYSGGPGRSGGNSGVLEVVISGMSSQFSILPLREAGQGGLGGEGGRGGQGGLYGSVCFPKLRKTGAPGDHGDQGPSGAEGSLEALCITKNNQRVCY